MKPWFICSCFLFMCLAAGARDQVVLENGEMRLVLEANACASSLVHKPTGQECLARGISIPAFTLTQYRPYNNELQLACPAKVTAFPADAVRREGDYLIVNFGIVGYEARIKLNITDAYISFTLENLVYSNPAKFGDTAKYPVDELCLLQLPLKPRKNYGDWMNVLWDDKVAVNLLGADPFAKIDGAKNHDHFLFSASSVGDVKLEGVGAALITTATGKLLDRVAAVEKDFNLPNGADSRRCPEYRWSYYEIMGGPLKDIDRHIAYAKQAGFKTMVVYYFMFAKSAGHFDYKPDYPGGIADVKMVVDKIKQAGMLAGLHFHYNKATKNDSYVEGSPDPRLNLSKILTLKAPLDAAATAIAVDENPQGSALEEGRRILKIGSELVTYESYTTTPPYQFKDCKRGQLKTQAAAHEAGLKMGVLDVDTWPLFVRFDQRTSIQEEVSERLAALYREAGFQFAYFDGAEDVHPPYWFTVSWPQWSVYSRLQPKPLFSEGACKSHFSWHILSRGNAFDVFKPEVLKPATRNHPLAEVERVACDFTSINFGWLGYYSPSKKTMGTQPDMLEYVSSRAVAWDCPISLQGGLAALDAHPRTPDNLEVLRRWEEVRVKNLLTAEQKQLLRNPDKEYHLLLNESNELEMVPYEQIKDAAGGDDSVRAFVFERKRKVYVAYWHTSGECSLEVLLPKSRTALMEQMGKATAVQSKDGSIVLSVSKLRYLEIGGLSKQKVIADFQQAKVKSL